MVRAIVTLKGHGKFRDSLQSQVPFERDQSTERRDGTFEDKPEYRLHRQTSSYTLNIDSSVSLNGRQDLSDNDTRIGTVSALQSLAVDMQAGAVWLESRQRKEIFRFRIARYS
jgi:hypothetical protein